MRIFSQKWLQGFEKCRQIFFTALEVIEIAEPQIDRERSIDRPRGRQVVGKRTFILPVIFLGGNRWWRLRGFRRGGRKPIPRDGATSQAIKHEWIIRLRGKIDDLPLILTQLPEVLFEQLHVGKTQRSTGDQFIFPR